LEQCYRLGIKAYVVKPVRLTQFVEAVKHIGVFWALINQPLPGSGPGEYGCPCSSAQGVMPIGPFN
jgi:hypothetical protein